MQYRRIKLRFRRRLRKGQQRVENISSQAEKHIDIHLFERFGSLTKVRRDIFSWLILMILIIGLLVAQNISLSGYYQTVKTAPGGIYREGVLGSFTNANPMFATSAADTTVAKLIFSGLMTFNGEGKLVGNLAKELKIDEKGATYTVTLKDNLKWHDGVPITSADVAYTYKTIQNPDTESPFQNSWRDITVTTPDQKTVVFTLANPLASFKYYLTNGIVPQHVLGSIAPADLRSSDFNTLHPIGSGPFKFKAITIKGEKKETAKEQIGLVPFAGYALGEPQIDEFIVNVFASEEELLNSFKDKQLNGMYGVDAIPKNIETSKSVIVNSLPLKAATMIFFKTTSSGPLSNTKIRNALTQATNNKQVVASLGYPSRAVNAPFLVGQVGYDAGSLQLGFNPENAKAILEAEGWKTGKNGIRYKDGKPLSIVISSADSPEYSNVLKTVKKQWKKVGVDMQSRLESQADFQSTIAYHSYDAVLYGITIGADPDVYVYWDSSQADIRSSNRLNLSEYKSPSADTSLESGRTRMASNVRAAKYKPFLKAWQQDSPAIALYQPRLLYPTNGPIGNLPTASLNSAVDRLSNVQEWQVRQARVTNE
jgi:peptide/nickel transport system substrate-binding protein